jgi:hypothetical protein
MPCDPAGKFDPRLPSSDKRKNVDLIGSNRNLSVNALISTISWTFTHLAELGGDGVLATFRQQFIACLHLTERLGPRVFVWDLSVKAQGSVPQNRSETWITPYFSVGNPVIERSTEL